MVKKSVANSVGLWGRGVNDMVLHGLSMRLAPGCVEVTTAAAPWQMSGP